MTDLAVRHVSLSGIQQTFIIAWAVISLLILIGAVFAGISITNDDQRNSCGVGCLVSLIGGAVFVYEWWVIATILYVVGFTNSTGF